MVTPGQVVRLWLFRLCYMPDKRSAMLMNKAQAGRSVGIEDSRTMAASIFLTPLP